MLGRPTITFLTARYSPFGRGYDGQFVDGGALLFGEALRGACRLADGIVGDGLGRAENFLGDVVLLEDNFAGDGDEAARRAESLDASLLADAIGLEMGFKYLFKIVRGLGDHACGNFFAADFEKEFSAGVHCAAPVCAAASRWRCSTQPAATLQVNWRTRPMSAARSVVEMAPRASRTLNRCEHFRQRS